MRKIWLLFALILAFGLLAIYMDYSKQEMTSMESPDKLIPSRDEVGAGAGNGRETVSDFQLKGLDGKFYSLEDVKGKPLVLNFWASWCSPCKMEAPILSRLYEKYKGEIEVYAVNLTSGDSIKGAQAFANKYKFSFPVLLDMEGKVGDLYQIQAIPTTYFINEQGVVIHRSIGLASPKVLMENFERLSVKK